MLGPIDMCPVTLYLSADPMSTFHMGERPAALGPSLFKMGNTS